MTGARGRTARGSPAVVAVADAGPSSTMHRPTAGGNPERSGAKGAPERSGAKAPRTTAAYDQAAQPCRTLAVRG